MTPFALLEKSAGLNLASIGGAIARGFKGFSRAPGDLVSLVSGQGMPAVARELGRSGQVGNILGHIGIGGGVLMGLNRMRGTASQNSTTNDAGATTLSREDFQREMEAHRLKPGQRGTGLTMPASKSWFNNPFTSEGRSRIGHNMQNFTETMSPMISGEELKSLYGDDPMAQFRAMSDPLLKQKRMAARGGYQ